MQAQGEPEQRATTRLHRSSSHAHTPARHDVAQMATGGIFELAPQFQIGDCGATRGKKVVR